MVVRLGHVRFLPNPLQFIINLSSYHPKICGLISRRESLNIARGIIYGGEYYDEPHYADLSTLPSLHPSELKNVLLRTLFSNTLKLQSSLRFRAKV
jgi:hypothetical protein